jgi:fatty-acyl-CoA synthase
MPYTSGTTGKPKGCMHTHSTVLATSTTGCHWRGVSSGAVVLAVLPMFHVTGMQGGMNTPIQIGGKMVVMTRWDRDCAAMQIERARVTAFTAITTMMVDFLGNPNLPKYDLSSLNYLGGGGAAMPEALAKKLVDRFGLEFIEGYGLSETCATSHVNPLHRPKTGSFGCPVPNMLAAVVDPETLEAVPQGQTGELLLSGPNVMAGYWQRPEETANSFVERHGRRWMRTGDIVRMDEEGYFHFYDRSKDLIKYKGYSIFAKDVEDVLYAHPQVKAAGVIGVPEPSVGQLIKAIVVLQGDARGKLSEEEIKAYCRQHLAEYKVPHIVEFRGELPKTDVGKVSRRELRDESAAP